MPPHQGVRRGDVAAVAVGERLAGEAVVGIDVNTQGGGRVGVERPTGCHDVAGAGHPLYSVQPAEGIVGDVDRTTAEQRVRGGRPDVDAVGAERVTSIGRGVDLGKAVRGAARRMERRDVRPVAVRPVGVEERPVAVDVDVDGGRVSPSMTQPLTSTPDWPEVTWSTKPNGAFRTLCAPAGAAAMIMMASSSKATAPRPTRARQPLDSNPLCVSPLMATRPEAGQSGPSLRPNLTSDRAAAPSRPKRPLSVVIR